MTRVAVMGSGSWGTAFAALSTRAGSDVVLWARRAEVAEEVALEHRNHDYLPGVELPDGLAATSDPAQALDGADVVVLAVPSIGLEDQLTAWGGRVPAAASLVSLVKGVDVDTLRFGSQTLVETLDADPSRVVVVSGPNLAAECVAGQPSATVAASPDAERAAQVQQAVMTRTFRVYTNPDVVGVEVGGAVKNVLAIAAGMADGRGYGANTLAAVITRGLAEMQRLGVALGGQALTFSGLAGVGDLVVTCTSQASRNQTVGRRLGGGEPLDAIVADMQMVAEGVKSSRAVLALAQRAGVDMPIVEGVVALLHEGATLEQTIAGLLDRDAKPELYGMDDEPG